jgi:hypothetical protein
MNIFDVQIFDIKTNVCILLEIKNIFTKEKEDQDGEED